MSTNENKDLDLQEEEKKNIQKGILYLESYEYRYNGEYGVIFEE